MPQHGRKQPSPPCLPERAGLPMLWVRASVLGAAILASASGILASAFGTAWAEPPEAPPSSTLNPLPEAASPPASGTSTGAADVTAPAPALAPPPATGAASEPGGETDRTAPAREPGDRPPASAGMTAAEPADETEEIVVTGQSESRRLRLSARAVDVIETEMAKLETADLGEILARTQGISFQRGGGVGADGRITLNGLTGDQIRFFIDGIPIAFSGYPSRIANLLINFVERIEIYRAVVPIEFGADALGGALNFVTAQDVEGTTAQASYQTGSFGLHRATVAGRYHHVPSGFFVRVEGSLDYADNDYRVHSIFPDEFGAFEKYHADRFHDTYRALGANLELGLTDRSWADRFFVRSFISGFTSDIQHSRVNMNIPYGDATYGELSVGATARYQKTVDAVSVDIVGGYAWNTTTFLDIGLWRYDPNGERINPDKPRDPPGETDDKPHDLSLWDDRAFIRALATWKPLDAHTFNISVTPTLLTRQGDERIQDPNQRDPLTAQRDVFSMVTGIDYQLRAFDDRLENILFFKHYLQMTRSEEVLPGDAFVRRDRDTHRVGFGNMFRYRLLPWLSGKTSYEFATRLPNPEEIFGDSVLIRENLDLAPEESHNVNAGFIIDAPSTSLGSWNLTLNGFLRATSQLIILTGDVLNFSYKNVHAARSLGFEAAGSWTSPGGYVELSANVTEVDYRNTSGEGTFGDFKGDRIPNQPYFFTNAVARLHYRGLLTDFDRISLAWNTRFVEEFFRSWESSGVRAYKDTIDAQLTHSLALTYVYAGEWVTSTFTTEVQNLTNQRVFDFFGIQKPGRSIYVKLTTEY